MTNEDEPSLREYFEAVTAQVAQEANLINNRLTWMLTFQGFLFAAMALIVSEDTPDEPLTFFAFFIPIVGLATSILACVGLKGAYVAMDDIKARWRDRAKGSEAHFPPAHGSEGATLLGRLSTYGTPAIAALAWLVLLVCLACGCLE